jgi:hypothetical protein
MTNKPLKIEPFTEKRYRVDGKTFSSLQEANAHVKWQKLQSLQDQASKLIEQKVTETKEYKVALNEMMSDVNDYPEDFSASDITAMEEETIDDIFYSKMDSDIEDIIAIISDLIKFLSHDAVIEIVRALEVD